MTRETGMATKKDIAQIKEHADHMDNCKLKNCNHCEPHRWIEIEKVRDWVADNAQEGRVGHFINAQDLLDFLNYGK